MVDSGHLADVLDVPHHVVDRRVRFGVAPDAFLEVCRERRVVEPVHALGARVDTRRVGPLADGVVDELRHEGHHAHAAVAWEQTQDIVGHVAHVGGLRKGAGVAEDHRRGRRRQRVAHRAGGDVREVDEHAEPIALANHLPTEGRQPTEPRRLGG